jgi:peptidoglycan/LPS O-acetylase OafA/YrhL
LNAALLGSLLYQSKLVPRALPVLGFVGATLLLAAWFAVLFGLIGPTSAPAAVAGLTIAAWEFSLGIYLTFWGFRPSPITADM